MSNILKRRHCIENQTVFGVATAGVVGDAEVDVANCIVFQRELFAECCESNSFFSLLDIGNIVDITWFNRTDIQATAKIAFGVEDVAILIFRVELSANGVEDLQPLVEIERNDIGESRMISIDAHHTCAEHREFSVFTKTGGLHEDTIGAIVNHNGAILNFEI